MFLFIHLRPLGGESESFVSEVGAADLLQLATCVGLANIIRKWCSWEELCTGSRFVSPFY